MEIWQILIICLLMLPAFYVANYYMVKRMVKQRKEREEMMERAVAISVARRMRSKADKYSPNPRFGSRRRP
jgi:preprotein translocase subunit YajC